MIEYGRVTVDGAIYTLSNPGTVLNILAGGAASNPGVLFIGSSVNNKQSNSSVIVSNGAALHIATTLNIGANATAGSMANLTVDNATVDARLVTLADSSNATLNIINGATLRVFKDASPVSGIFYGSAATIDGSESVTTISGAGSKLIVEGTLFSNATGKSTITVDDGGAIESVDSYLGSYDGTSNITISGVGSYWTNTNELGVGNGQQYPVAGAAVLYIKDGAEVTTKTLSVSKANATGSIHVDGKSSNLVVQDTAFIGVDGVAILTVSNGGSATFGGFGAQARFVLGQNSGATGTLSVDGVGSNVTFLSSVDVGLSGQGAIKVSNGAHIDASSVMTFVGYSEKVSNNGSVLISGAGSTWVGPVTLAGASADAALFKIENGGVATSSSLAIGTAASSGHVIVDGQGSEWNINDSKGNISRDVTLVVGGNSSPSSRLDITNGGVVNFDGLSVTIRGGTEGSIINVSGAGSQFNAISQYGVIFGQVGKSTLNVTSGGAVNLNNELIVGTVKNGNSSNIITVDGANSVLSIAGLTLAYGGGDSTLNLSNGAVLKSSGDIQLTRINANTTATLNIGAGVGSAAVMPGIVDGERIVFGNGSGSINFNHTSDNYLFSAQITEATDGATNGTIHQIAGRTVLTANSSGFGGKTDITGGALVVNNVLGGAVNIGNKGRLEGTGTVGSTINAGIVAPGDNGIGTLTISGNYAGDRGTVLFDTQLGDDKSPTDFLHITGNAAGTTNVQVFNRNGLGALTVGDGIQLIQVDGSSDKSNFALKSDYSFEGQAAVIGGAYAYSLYAGNQAGAFAGDWYLRSLYVEPTEPPIDPTNPVIPEPVKPVYAATVPMYEVYPQVLQQLNKLGTLEQRVGNRTWLATTADAQTALLNELEGRGFWMKVEGSTGHVNPDVSKTKSDYDLNMIKTQLGLDIVASDTDKGKLVGGIYFQYGHAKADVSSRYGDGSIKTDGYGVGGTLTWYGANDVYVDGVAQVMWYDTDVRSDWLNNRDLVNGNDGTGYALSLEGGKKIVLNHDWTMTPQAQLSYNSVDFDSFHDGYGGRVNREDGDALTGRLGLAFNREQAWKSAAGDMRRLKTYGIGNLYYEFLNGTEVSVTNVDFRNRSDRFWGGLGGGVSYNWKDDAYSIYGEVDGRTSFSDFADSYSLNGTVGFKAKF
ncbi:autotransporter outer membrane beta-barrel domain-containing protein [Bartonella sp. LJL80]